ncbi:hypothetical protein MRB53_025438 [Persea americana]|uniref:Uncharacterized protein n=1 Tax=Persea americana TaxID=3435 RepID=A0ACC2LG80_PERAE|nr:hypothetical protein MRB53_025438 [Persea americana]
MNTRTLTQSVFDFAGTSPGNASDRWSPDSPSPDGFIRLDFDGPLIPFIGSAGIGGVVCDEMGRDSQARNLKFAWI